MLFYPHPVDCLGGCGRSARIMVLLLLSLIAECVSAEPELPVLTTDTSLATAGYYQLSWQPGLAVASNKILRFELQQSSDSGFHRVRTIYRGPDRASVISGQANGDYYYRVRILYSGRAIGHWSKQLLVRVRHHSLQKAWLFFIAGATVFCMILFFIVLSSRRMDEA